MSTQPSGQSVAKRQKLHPLRQTSYPVDVAASYSAATPRSETGSVTNSQFSATTAASNKRPRGRPRKSLQVRPEDLPHNQQSTSLQAPNDARSNAGARSVVSAKSGAADQDEEEEAPEHVADLNEEEKNEEKAAEARQYALVDTFDDDQTVRYSAWRRLKLKPEVLKRLVNATVSQSVSTQPLSTVNQFSKYFIGEIVERARDVQLEFAKAYEKTREEERKWRRKELERLEEKQRSGEVDDYNKILARDIARLRREVDEYIPNPHKGGMLPDHLREALRRYRADGEGGGAGFEGLSHGLLGVTGSATWRIGDGAVAKRLFR
jgi:transcription initiation factor TFIID subunit 11